MRSFAVVLAFGIAAGMVLTPAFAYEIPVHEQITVFAAQRALGRIDLESRLGVSPHARINGNTATYWMTVGARREDDIHQSFPPARSIHHFLDPVHDAPLTVGMPPLCTDRIILSNPPAVVQMIAADRWALEPRLLNRWGLPDARQYERQAVLGPNPGHRAKHSKYLFVALGHIVHLLQDMAQPEHTRNDQHLLPFGADVASFYEEWTLDNLVGPSRIPDADAYYEGYDAVALPSFAAYFHSPDGRGLADYSNRNFVTQDTNFDDEQSSSKCFSYAQPSLSDATARIVTIAEQVRDGDGNVVCCEEVQHRIYESRPADRFRPSSDADAYHTVESSLDFDTRFYDPTRLVFSLAPTSYQTRAALLLPRAVGYSQGLIEHYFRGVIDARWERAAGAYQVTITNRSPDYLYRDARITAIFRATPEYFGRTGRDDTAVVLWNEPIAEISPWFDGLAPGQSVSLHVPHVPLLRQEDSLLEFERRIVIEGRLGAEAAAVMTNVTGPSTAGFRARMKVTPMTSTVSFVVSGYDAQLNRFSASVRDGHIVHQERVTTDISRLPLGEVTFAFERRPLWAGGNISFGITPVQLTGEIHVTDGDTVITSGTCTPNFYGCSWSFFDY